MCLFDVSDALVIGSWIVLWVSAGDDWVIWSWHCCVHHGFTSAVR